MCIRIYNCNYVSSSTSSLKKRSFRKQIVTINSTIRYFQRTFGHKIRNRKVACSYTLETKSTATEGKGGEKKRRSIPKR